MKYQVLIFLIIGKHCITLASRISYTVQNIKGRLQTFFFFKRTYMTSMQKLNSSTSLMSSPSSGPVSTSAFLPPALCRFSTVFSRLSRLTSFLFLGLLIVPSAQTQNILGKSAFNGANDLPANKNKNLQQEVCAS